MGVGRSAAAASDSDVVGEEELESGARQLVAVRGADLPMSPQHLQRRLLRCASATEMMDVLLKHRATANLVNVATALHLMGKVAQGVETAAAGSGAVGTGRASGRARAAGQPPSPPLSLALSSIVPPSTDRLGFYRYPGTDTTPPQPSLLLDPRFWRVLALLERLLQRPNATFPPRTIASIVHGLGRCGLKVDIDGQYVSNVDGSQKGALRAGNPTAAAIARSSEHREVVTRVCTRLADLCVAGVGALPVTTQALALMAWGFAKMGFVQGRSPHVDAVWDAVARTALGPAGGVERGVAGPGAALPQEGPAAGGTGDTENTGDRPGPDAAGMGGGSPAPWASVSVMATGHGDAAFAHAQRAYANAVPPSPSAASAGAADTMEVWRARVRGDTLPAAVHPSTSPATARLPSLAPGVDAPVPPQVSAQQAYLASPSAPAPSSIFSTGQAPRTPPVIPVTAQASPGAAAAAPSSASTLSSVALAEAGADVLLDAFLPKELATLVFAFTKAGLHSSPLLEACAARVIAHPDHYAPYDLAIVIWSFAKMGRRNDALVEVVRQRFLRDHSDFMVNDVSNVAWSLALLGEMTPEVVRALHLTLSRISAKMGTSIAVKHLSQLYLVHLALRYTPSLTGLPAAPTAEPTPIETAGLTDASYLAYRAHNLTLSRFHQHVAIILHTKIGTMPSLEFVTDEGLSLDFAWPARKWAIEVDGPSHFVQGTTSFTPETALKMGILQALGWTVQRLAWWEWERTEATQDQVAVLLPLCPPGLLRP